MPYDDDKVEASLLNHARKACQHRLKSMFENIYEKYGKSVDMNDDEVDILTGEIYVDRGRLRQAEPVGWGGYDGPAMAHGSKHNGSSQQDPASSSSSSSSSTGQGQKATTKLLLSTSDPKEGDNRRERRRGIRRKPLPAIN